MKNAVTKFFVIAQSRCVGCEEILQNLANYFPSRPTQREKLIQRIAREDLTILQIGKMTSLLEHGKIDNVLAERDADPRPIIARFKNPCISVLTWSRNCRIG